MPLVKEQNIKNGKCAYCGKGVRKKCEKRMADLSPESIAVELTCPKCHKTWTETYRLQALRFSDTK
jgi:hypothetical protein